MTCPIDSWTFRPADFLGEKRSVFEKGGGAPVLLMHELPGLTPACVQFGERLVADGFRVSMPLLFGGPCQDRGARPILDACVRREFNFLARNETSPVADWLRACCADLSSRASGRAVGVIGMCLTGGLAMVLIAEPSVGAAVSSEPALPFFGPSSIGMSSRDVAASRARMDEQGRRLLTFRFSSDVICPAGRFDTIAKAFGANVEAHTIVSPDPAKGISRRAHSVLTTEFQSDPQNPTNVAYRRVVAFLHENLS